MTDTSLITDMSKKNRIASLKRFCENNSYANWLGLTLKIQKDLEKFSTYCLEHNKGNQRLAASILSRDTKRKVYFYDDDKRNWKFTDTLTKKNTERIINFIHIKKGETGPVADKYIKLLEPYKEQYTRYYDMEINELCEDWYYPDSGVKSVHLKALKRDIKNNKVSAIVFDFDCTLQLFEGANIGSHTKELGTYNPVTKNSTGVLKLLKKLKFIPKKFTQKGLAEFILHDKNDAERINNLRTTLKFAQSFRIPIFIITNNSLPKSGQEQILKDLLIFLGIKPLYNSVFGGGTFYKNEKYNVIIDSVLPIVRKVSMMKDIYDD